MGRVRHDDCADRWTCEARRLVMFRRQRATVHANATRPLAEIVADAEHLDDAIALTAELMDAICDEHNGHTAGTWEHSQRGPHVPVSA